MVSMSEAILVRSRWTESKVTDWAATLGIMACNVATSARSVGVDEKVGKPAMVAVPWSSWVLNGTAGCKSESSTGSLMPSCAA